MKMDLEGARLGEGAGSVSVRRDIFRILGGKNIRIRAYQ